MSEPTKETGTDFVTRGSETAGNPPIGAVSATSGGSRSESYGGGGGGGRGRGAGPGGRGPRRPRSGDSGSSGDGKGGSDLAEKVVFINRSAKVVKGGRRFSFSALVVVGDKRGSVGLGLGKAAEVAEAIRKGGEIAKNHMMSVSLKENTIPHEVNFHFCGANVLLRPASPGTGVIAGKTVRAVIESVGIKDVLSKSLGSKNAANVVKATLGALKQLRLRQDIYLSRGIPFKKEEKTTQAATATA